MAEFSIGPLGDLEAHIPGLSPALRVLSHAPEHAEVGRGIGRLYQRMKGYNDSPVGQVMGSWGGQTVRNGPSEESSWGNPAT